MDRCTHMYIFKIQEGVYHTVSSNCLWTVGLWVIFISLWVFICNIWDILQLFFFRLLCKYRIFNKCFFRMQKNHKILGFFFLIEVNIFNSGKRHIIQNLPFSSIQLVVLSTFTLLCNQTPGSFHPTKLKPYPLNNSPPYPHLQQFSTVCLHVFDHPRNLLSLSFCDWLILLNMMSLSFIQVVTCVRISFLFKVK